MTTVTLQNVGQESNLQATSSQQEGRTESSLLFPTTMPLRPGSTTTTQEEQHEGTKSQSQTLQTELDVKQWVMHVFR